MQKKQNTSAFTLLKSSATKLPILIPSDTHSVKNGKSIDHWTTNVSQDIYQNLSEVVPSTPFLRKAKYLKKKNWKKKQSIKYS